MTTFKQVVEQAAMQAAMDANPPECEHQRSEVRERKIRGGSVQHVRQCLDCGEPLGNPLKQNGSAKPFDEGLRERYQEWRQSVRETAKQRESEAWWAHYREYMASPQWLSRREKVLQRDGRICRGCLTNEATEVHHLTYENFGAEFAFQLMSLCRPCHKRYHAEQDGE